jgi:cell wall-associated NlpC family hydrolase
MILPTLLVSVVIGGLDSIPGLGDILSQICSPADATGPEQLKTAPKPNSIPKNYLTLYRQAGAEYNIPWNVLAGIGWVETHHGTLQAAGVHSGENYAGAGGPMQFIASTWRSYSLDGNGDGQKNRYDPADAIPAAARYLKASGAPGDIRRAIYAYNHSDDYVNDVLAAANIIGRNYDIAPSNYGGQDCASLGLGATNTGPLGQRIATLAAHYARKDPGKPNVPNQVSKPIAYSWGGGNLDGPTYGIAQGTNIYGFDCSSFARYIVYQASDKKIILPRTADAQFYSNKGVRVPREQLTPGDLVFFHSVAGRPQHMGIYFGVSKGKHWMVEAPHTGEYVRFTVLDGYPAYAGALRVTPPPGTEDEDKFRAMPPFGAGPAVV